jgi:outer membrane protein
MYKKIVVFSLFAALSTAVYAQKVWTLQECLDYAAKNNLVVQQSGLNVKDARNSRDQSVYNMLPTANGFATNNFNFGRSIDPFTNTFSNQQIRNNSFGVSSSVTLFGGLQNMHNMKQQELLYKASRYDLDNTLNNLGLQIANAYLTILLNEEILLAARIQSDNTKTQLDRAEKLYSAGSINISNVLDLKAQKANEDLNVINAQNQLQLAYLALWQLLEMPYDEKNTIEKPRLAEPAVMEEPVAAQLFNSYTGRGPDIQAAQTRALASRYALRMARSGRSPRLTLNGNINTTYSESFLQSTGTLQLGTRILYYDNNGNPVSAPYSIPTGYEITPFNTQLSNNLGKSIGFTLSIPILSNWTVNTNIQRAKVNMERSRLNEQQVRNQVYRTITQATTDLKAAKVRYAAAKNSYEAAGASFRNAEQRFNLGAMNFTDYSVAKNNHMRAETTMLQARYELIFRMKVVDFYNGKPIALQ